MTHSWGKKIKLEKQTKMAKGRDLVDQYTKNAIIYTSYIQQIRSKNEHEKNNKMFNKCY